MKSLLVLCAQLLLAVASAAAQEATSAAAEDKCDGPVYKMTEVSRKAVVKKKPDPGFTEEARANNTSGTVSLAAVLCHTGRITDMQVLKALPHGLTEMAVAAASRVEFTPAEKDGRPVATHVRFEYNFNAYGGEDCKDGACAGRLVEELMIEGNRRLTDDELVRHVKTRPGDAYDEEQARRDLQALRELPLLDKTATGLSVEHGRRGGVVVIFNIVERPIIRDIQFAGLYAVGEEDVLKAWSEGGVRVCKECPYDPSAVTAAADAIRKLLAARGLPEATVKTQVGAASQLSVTLAFIVNERP